MGIKVDPWTTQVWTAWVHSYTLSVPCPINSTTQSATWFNPWIQSPTINLHTGFYPSVSVLNPCTVHYSSINYIAIEQVIQLLSFLIYSSLPFDWNILGWFKSSFEFFLNNLWENPNKLFGQSSRRNITKGPGFGSVGVLQYSKGAIHIQNPVLGSSKCPGKVRY